MDTIVLKPKDIILHLCESEEKLWMQRDASECSINTDLGSSILGECKCLKEIHDHFSSLDKRKCCLSLTVCKTTFTNFRVVRNDGRDSNIEEGAMSKTSIDALPFVPELNNKEFRVFRYAYMCASYPVLGAPDPPSPQTPPMTPTELGSSRFQFRDFKTHRLNSQSHLDSSTEDETSVVPAETLFELLRRIFRLCQKTFCQYEIFMHNSYSKRDTQPNRILAEEMVGQLAALENNSNPFYKPKLFMTQFGYDRWQRKEFNHIAELMRKFWHVAHPHTRSNNIQFLESVHEDYIILMEKLLRYESAYRIADNTQITLLSSASIRLLKEFGLRYGIGETFRRIVYLRYLVSNFDHSVWFIQHCTTAVISLLEVLPNNEDMVRKELEVLSESIRKLQIISLSTLSKMKSIFPDNQPPGGIDALINLMDKTLEAKVHLKMPKTASLDDIIVHCLKEIFPSSYNEMKMVAITDLKQERNGVLTPYLLNMMIVKIRDEVNYFKKYEEPFNRFSSVTSIAAQSLYTLFMEDLKQYFTIHHSQPVASIINRQLLGLGYRLHQLDEDWATYVSGHPNSQMWRQNFHKESLHWLNILKLHIQKSTLKSVGSDKFTSQSFDDVGSSYQVSMSSISSPRDRSFSLKSITPSINSAFSGLASSNSMSINSAFSGLASSNSTPVYNNIWNAPNTNTTNPQWETPFTKSKTSNSAKTFHFVKQKSLLEPDTRSLDGFHDTEGKHIHEIDEGKLTYGSLRSCSSLPEILSKSYDHYLTVSRKTLSFSQQIGNKQNDENNQNKPISTKSINDNPLVQITVTEFSPAVDDNQRPSGIESDMLDDKREIDCLDGDIVSDIENDQSDSDHSNDFSFPPLSEVANQDRTEPLSQLTNQDRTEPLSQSTNQDRTEPLSQSTNQDRTEPLSQSKESSKRKNMLIDDPRPQKIVPLIPYQQSEHIKSDSGSKPHLHRPIARAISKPEHPETPVSTISHDSSNVKKKAVLPVSSSSLDLTVILQRLMEFGQTLCYTFLQRTMTHFGGIYPAVSVSTQDMKRKMFEAHSEVVCNIFRLYADNMVCFDLCGTTRSEAVRLAGPMLIDHLQRQGDKNLIWGCRHNLCGEKDCFRYQNNRAELLCNRYEHVTKDMCTRINNVCLVLEYIESYYQRLGKVFNIQTEGKFKSKISDEDNTQTPSTVSLDVAHVSTIIRVQCRIMAYRINLFVNDAITVLLSLRRPSVSIQVCLIPLTQFLQSYIHSLSEWLYSSCYKRVMEYLWIFIVQNFERQVFEILQGVHGSIEHAQLLIQAFTHLLKFMTEQKKAIRISLLLPQAEDVMFKLQLCATPTRQLITLYKQVKDYVDKCDASSMYNSDITLQLILHKLREDLLKYRKCFSGAQLVKWVMKNPDLVKSLGVPIEWNEMSRDVAILVGRRLLDFQLIQDTESNEDQDLDSSHDLEASLDLIPDEYPQLSILDTVPKGDNISSGSDTTPTGITHDSHVSQKPNRSVRSTGITSPVQLLREKQLSRKGPSEVQYTCDTPMSFSTMFMDSDGPVFENCDTHYYILASIRSLHETEKQDSELNTLVDQCFQSRISPDYLLHIIYSRRKIDSYAKIFLHNQPLHVIKKLKGDLDEHSSCEIS